ncbi:hypothetical protein Lal_00010185 [Lupinus albus]|uniref:Putative bifunctional inhibitor/plant lipid transfer protein/seed storage helical n=1 Tax=Lupinus albus TaxID=3870 RepID=A0A6A5LDR3_LUPAL|nr:putative bifunctional inhibitor/plant lipid transfer protein/seed storage helical [Lupinus albus]KAF1859601.1 hypothetical protein Lal_00010185 [Lupinus albus]
MVFNTLISFCIIFSSLFIHPGFSSDSSLDQLLGGLGDLSALQDAQCMQKLLPCKTVLNSSTINNPSPACCNPLNEILTNDTACICSFINNPQLLVSMNIAKDDLLKLPDACGLDADISMCDNVTSTPPSTPIADSTNTVPVENAPPAEDSKGSTKMITQFGGPGFVALFTALIFSAY